MEVTFSSKKLQKVFNSRAKLNGEYGPKMAALIAQRLYDLNAAGNLEEMRLLPGRCHELVGNLKGHLALDLLHPKRLIFVPDHDPRPQLGGGRLDWVNVTRVKIIKVIDYHN